MSAAAPKPALFPAGCSWRTLLVLAIVVFGFFGLPEFVNLTLPAAAQSIDPAAPASIHGTVINAVTGQPIAHALVSCASESMLTDNEGHFSFALATGTPSMSATIQARRPGYGGWGDSEVASQAVSAAASGVDVTLALTPLSAIVGELSLSGADAADGLQIQLLHREIRNGRGRWSVYRSTQTTSEGRFRFGNLSAGAYLVHVAASLDPAPAQVEKIRFGYVSVFYPSAREIAGAGVINLAAGQQVEAKMALTREPYYPVLVPVVGEASRGIGFQISSDSFLGLSVRFSPQDGMVHMELPNGHYRLEGRSFGPTALAGQREIDVNGAPLQAGAITLTPMQRIPVSVHADFSPANQPPTADGKVLTAENQVSLDLVRDGSAAAVRGSRPSLQDDTTSGETGVSFLTNVSPGRYWVNAHAFHGYVASATSGGVDLLEEPLVVGADGSASPILLTLRDDTASFSATLGSSLMEAADNGAQVHLYLVPRSGGAEERTEGFPKDGTVQLSSLAPGNYLAFAAMAQQQLEYRDSRFLAALTGKAQTVTLEPGGTGRVTLDVVVDLAALGGRATP